MHVDIPGCSDSSWEASADHAIHMTLKNQSMMFLFNALSTAPGSAGSFLAISGMQCSSEKDHSLFNYQFLLKQTH